MSESKTALMLLSSLRFKATYGEVVDWVLNEAAVYECIRRARQEGFEAAREWKWVTWSDYDLVTDDVYPTFEDYEKDLPRLERIQEELEATDE